MKLSITLVLKVVIAVVVITFAFGFFSCMVRGSTFLHLL